MKKERQIPKLPKELIKPSEIDTEAKGGAVEFLCNEFGNGTTCRINRGIDEADDILF
ncbi:hypothetical protein [Flagellimonas meridianipacifica]|uniref:Uncharacterized protein n=1 Tax=Flagellimonas meridianipacifica TaxID=1080225 RepID=A0A2T0MFP4_9FLAO|nr:hypothetical protein [Allomuricauda pacifica]PRX56384.1 hypothetical protein CLV81_0381 [Allomuricauda pacifica]